MLLGRNPLKSICRPLCTHQGNGTRTTPKKMAPPDDERREKGKIRADTDIMNVTPRVEALTEALQRHISEVQYRRPAYGYAGMRRPRAHGKFLFVGDEKFWIRGVTYGTFKTDAAGMQFTAQSVVASAFRAISNAGF